MSKYYSLDRINKKKATYNVIIGERSNGKTYAATTQAVKEYVKNKSQFAYVRRWKEDVIGRRASQLFSGHAANGAISEITNGEFDGVHYFSGKYYLCRYDENGKAIYGDSDVIGYTFALSDGEHNKSTSYPNIRTIIFDEFLTPHTYLREEFVLFMNTVSTIVRRRDDVRIYMLANTVNKFSPYFSEMGLNHIQKMEQGSIDVYKYGESKLTVAVEYCKTEAGKKNTPNAHYFAFNNPKLEMITGGAWELNIYPHLPVKYTPKNIMATYYIVFSDTIFECEIITVNGATFTYIHKKTTPIKNPDDALVYRLEPSAKLNYNRSVFKPATRFQQKVVWFFKHDKVFYQDNEVGDAINNYLKQSRNI